MMRAGAHDYLIKDNLSRLMTTTLREITEARMRRERGLSERPSDAFNNSPTRATTSLLSSITNRRISGSLADCIDITRFGERWRP